MKFEYQGRWLRVCLEIFPRHGGEDRIRYAALRREPALRRKLMRRIRLQLNPPKTAN